MLLLKQRRRLFLGVDPCEHICRVPPVHYFLQLSLQVRARLHELFQRALGDLSHVARARFDDTRGAAGLVEHEAHFAHHRACRQRGHLFLLRCGTGSELHHNTELAIDHDEHGVTFVALTDDDGSIFKGFEPAVGAAVSASAVNQHALLFDGEHLDEWILGSRHDQEQFPLDLL